MTFDEWFIAEHGPREQDFDGKSDGDLLKLIHHMEAAESEFRSRKDWDRRKTSARWAWNAAVLQRVERKEGSDGDV